MLNAILKSLTDSTKDISAAAVLTRDGLVMAATVPEQLDEDYLCAISAGMFALSGRASRFFHHNAPEQIELRTPGGYFLLTVAGPDVLLAVTANPEAQRETLLPAVRTAADAAHRLLQ
jgi:uncharacterized protein